MHQAELAFVQLAISNIAGPVWATSVLLSRLSPQGDAIDVSFTAASTVATASEASALASLLRTTISDGSLKAQLSSYGLQGTEVIFPLILCGCCHT